MPNADPAQSDSPCPHGNRFCGQPGWSRCGACCDDITAFVAKEPIYVDRDLTRWVQSEGK